MIKVTVWNEYRHEKLNETVAQIYPNGMHHTIAEALQTSGFQVHTAVLDDPEHGLTEAVLRETDVLVWWGHIAHDEVSDAIVERVQRRVLDGMGLIVLHSGHFSKIFKVLMGTTCSLRWREADEKERIWTVNPSHPIAQGIPEQFVLPQEEMYGEFFDIPEPAELVFVSWFQGGEVFRSGCTFRRGRGKIFYFRPGHETYATYHNPHVQRIITNAAAWAAPSPELVVPREHQGPWPSFEPVPGGK
ncbi:ThuA domain-containing protein [Paenibacillus turpanensis]|uniref:ThuA domain-containing protein n=1 Tax=Paenibacillus turpanensis TaxID=2689078 RepID=UPI0014079BF7|nr:ThuA domain-containing protein [Paenibacillus turpanensis]